MASEEVEVYICVAPVAARAKLRVVRSAIREGVPDAEESISYRMPHYSYKGEAGVVRAFQGAHRALHPAPGSRGT